MYIRSHFIQGFPCLLISIGSQLSKIANVLSLGQKTGCKPVLLKHLHSKAKNFVQKQFFSKVITHKYSQTYNWGWVNIAEKLRHLLNSAHFTVCPTALFVVYFDQPKGTSQGVCWSKSFSVLFHFFNKRWEKRKSEQLPNISYLYVTGGRLRW